LGTLISLVHFFEQNPNGLHSEIAENHTSNVNLSPPKALFVSLLVRQHGQMRKILTCSSPLVIAQTLCRLHLNSGLPELTPQNSWILNSWAPHKTNL